MVLLSEHHTAMWYEEMLVGFFTTTDPQPLLQWTRKYLFLDWYPETALSITIFTFILRHRESDPPIHRQLHYPFHQNSLLLWVLLLSLR